MLVLALWQLAGSAALVSPLFLPPPSAIALALWKLAISGALWQHVSVSVMRIGSGWIIGTAAGVLVGFAIGLFRVARGVGIPFVSALFPIPKIALLPLLILWFGIGEQPKVATIALGVFFPTVISAYSGCRCGAAQPDPHGPELRRAGADIVRQIDLAGRAAGILAGFRISASVALLAGGRPK